MTDPDAFRTDGGATWLNLLATQGQSFGPHPVERLRSPDDLGRWLALMGLPVSARPDGHDVERARALREALRDLAMAAVEGRAPSADALALVDATLAARAGLQVDGPLPGVAAALAEIATQATVTLRGPDRALLRACDERDCRWVFLDTSGRRRWCPAPACASRGRVRAYRARRDVTQT